MSVVPDPERALDAHEASTVDLHHDLHTHMQPSWSLYHRPNCASSQRAEVGASTGDRLSV